MKATTLIIAAVSLATTALAHQAVSGHNDEAALAATDKEVSTEVSTPADSRDARSVSQDPAAITPAPQASELEHLQEVNDEPASWMTVPEPGSAALGVIGLSMILLRHRK